MAGPVVAAADLAEACAIPGLNDSKKDSKSKHKEICCAPKRHCDRNRRQRQSRLDQVNIYEATKLAMMEARSVRVSTPASFDYVL